MTKFDYLLICFWTILFLWFLGQMTRQDVQYAQSLGLKIKTPKIYNLIWIIPLVIAYRVWG